MYTNNVTITSQHIVHYVNSIAVGIVSMILIRTLRRDIAKYNQEDEMVMNKTFMFNFFSSTCKI